MILPWGTGSSQQRTTSAEPTRITYFLEMSALEPTSRAQRYGMVLSLQAGKRMQQSRMMAAVITVMPHW